jgi:hypothetical protein
MSYMMDVRTCRICLESEGGKLISPCLCKGTMKYVHATCLDTWRETKTQSSRSYFQCDQCLYTYHFRRTTLVNLLRMSLFLHVCTCLSYIGICMFIGVVCHGFHVSLFTYLFTGNSMMAIVGFGMLCGTTSLYIQYQYKGFSLLVGTIHSIYLTYCVIQTITETVLLKTGDYIENI